MQRNLLHRGIVLLAGLLLCLHTAIPHMHGSLHLNAPIAEINEKTSCVEEGLLHLIKDLLSSDLGEDHLENFTPDLNKGLSAELVIIPTWIPGPRHLHIIIAPATTSARQVANYLANLPPDDPVTDSDLSRGPPTFA